MKPRNFGYVRPCSVEEVCRLLKAGDGTSKIVAGGQSLGPMLNLRLAQPEQLIDITSLGELAGVREENDAIVFGACITHAAFEDRRVPDPSNGFLSEVARGIAYRAVRNRGTIAGSLVHADPSADWLTTLTALQAEMVVASPGGSRRTPLEGFMTGPFVVELSSAEFVIGVRVPRLPATSKVGYFKFCRKRGEFAEAMAAVVFDADKGVTRVVVGATDSCPIVIDSPRDLPAPPADGSYDERLAEQYRQKIEALNITTDEGKKSMHAAALLRAAWMARS